MSVKQVTTTNISTTQSTPAVPGGSPTVPLTRADAPLRSERGITAGNGSDRLSLTADPEAMRAILQQSGLNLDLTPSGQKFIESLPPDSLAGLKSFSSALNTGIGAGPGGTINISGSGDLQSRWADYMGKVALNGAVDVNALVQSVLREAYMETTNDLAFYAEKVKFYNSVKKAIRDELTAARNEMANHAGKKDEEGIPGYPAKGVVADFVGGGATPGASTEAYQGEPVDTKGKLDSYIKGLEEKLNSVGDDAQLANVDLQNMLQKQQQTLQMMSNISKMLHDTAMAVIRKIGG